MKLTNQIAVNPIGSRLFEGVASSSQVTTSTKLSSPGQFNKLRVVLRNHMANHAAMKFAVAATATTTYQYAADNFVPVTWGGQQTLTPSDSVWYLPTVTLSDAVSVRGTLDATVDRYHIFVRGYPVTLNGGWYSYPKPPLSAARAITAANRGEVYQIGTKSGDFVTTSSDFTDSTTAQMVGAVFTTVNPGLSVMGIGDSLLQCDEVSLSDSYSSYGLRACADASALTLPIGWWNAGGSGFTTSLYKSQGQALAATLNPNVIIYHAWSPNDLWGIDATSTDGDIQVLADAMMQRTNEIASYCAQNEITLIVCTGIPQPKAGKLDTVSRDNIRKAFNTAIRASFANVLDLAGLIGDGASPEGMQPALSEGDGTHYNEAALEVIAASLSPQLVSIAAAMDQPGGFSSVYNLIPNIDVTQHTDYPLGNKGVTGGPIGPTPDGSTDINQIFWTMNMDAEPDGTTYGGGVHLNPWGAANMTNGEISSEVLLAGHKSFKEVIVYTGSDVNDAVEGIGFNKSTSSVTPFENGNESWLRVWVYHMPGFDWSAGPGHRKTMRMREQNPQGTYAGGSADLNYTGSRFATSFGPAGTFIYSRESVFSGDTQGWDIVSQTHQFQTGVWECLEMYVKSHTDPAQGMVKVWKNGELIWTKNTQTLLTDNNRLVDHMFINYWNAPVPQTTPVFYWSMPAIAVRNSQRDDTPYMDTDTTGFPFIGLSITGAQ